MDYENLIVEREAGVGIVTINRPRVLNALNVATVRELDAVFEDLAADAEVAAVILTGAGEKAFVAGADIGDLGHLPEVELLVGIVEEDDEDTEPRIIERVIHRTVVLYIEQPFY